MRQSIRPLAALATMVTGVGVGVFALAPADTTTVTYFYSGAEQTLHIPVDVHQVHVDAVGGRGGSSSNPSFAGDEAGGTARCAAPTST